MPDRRGPTMRELDEALLRDLPLALRRLANSLDWARRLPDRRMATALLREAADAVERMGRTYLKFTIPPKPENEKPGEKNRENTDSLPADSQSARVRRAPAKRTSKR